MGNVCVFKNKKTFMELWNCIWVKCSTQIEFKNKPYSCYLKEDHITHLRKLESFMEVEDVFIEKWTNSIIFTHFLETFRKDVSV